MSKTILITDTSNGFGKDAAKTLAEAGHQVFATMRNANDRNRAAAEELRSRGISVLELDVTEDSSVEDAFGELYKKTGGRLDVLINNAGIFAQGTVRLADHSLTPDGPCEMYDVRYL